MVWERVFEGHGGQGRHHFIDWLVEVEMEML